MLTQSSSIDSMRKRTAILPENYNVLLITSTMFYQNDKIIKLVTRKKSEILNKTEMQNFNASSRQTRLRNYSFIKKEAFDIYGILIA